MATTPHDDNGRMPATDIAQRTGDALLGLGAKLPRWDMSRFFDSPKLSDVSLRLGDYEFHGHRAILAARSAFFSKAYEGEFEEATKRTTELHDDDPEIFRAMLRFLYDKNYVPEGTELRPPAMLFHVKVYAIADKYDIPALRTAAAVKFYRSCSYGFSEGAEHYVSALRAIYSTTPASDHELRSRALSICKDKRNLNYLLSGESFRNAIPELHELCKELSKAPSSGPYCMEMPDYGEPVYKCRNERCNII